MSLRAVCNYFRKFLVDVNLRNGGFIISAADLYFSFLVIKLGITKRLLVYMYVQGNFFWKGVWRRRLFILKRFLKHTSSHNKRKKSKLVELEVPLLRSLPSEPFSKPTSLKMTFIDFHSMRVILQNEDGRVRERNLPCVTCGIGVPPYPVLLYLFCFLYPETCTLGIIRSSVSWSEPEYSILIDQFMCSFIQQTFIEQACPRHWRY